MRYFATTEQGRRDQNEDNVLTQQINTQYLFAIADGIGGNPFGEVASKIALDTLIKTLKQTNNLAETIKTLNTTIFEENQKRNTTMGTTLVTCLIDKLTNTCTIANVGDSRAYIFTDTIWKTKDHSLVQELLDKRAITEEDSYQHPQKNIITNALGTKETVQVDLYQKNITNAIIVLCSDGLSDYVRDEEIKKIATKYPPKKACKKLIQQALEKKSKDNISVIVATTKN